MSRDAIVCVDDEAIILISLIQELKDHYGGRFMFETAMSGEEALDLVDDLADEGIRTAFIITDWMMPNMKGDQLLVSARSKYPQLKGILITGQADAESIDRVCSDPEKIIVINKPWRTEDLVAAIDTMSIR